MLNKEAIQELAQAEAISAAQVAVASNFGSDDDTRGFAALPESFKLHDLEASLPQRRRLRGAMRTAVVEHFAQYVSAHAEAGATVFVNKEQMQAVAVLNLGTPEEPGHADNTATLVLEKKAPYVALCQILANVPRGLSQRELAEFMEDWALIIDCRLEDGTYLATKHAIDAVRKITIDSARKVESTEGQLSAEMSALEKVAASSAGNPLPALIRFQCEPFHGLTQRLFELRLGVRTGDANKANLSLTLRMVKVEQHVEEMAVELAGLVTYAIGSTAPVLVGSYSAKA